MSDILRQVDEDLRKEKLSNLFKKYGLYVILTLVIIIGSVIGYQVMVSIDKSKNEKLKGKNHQLFKISDVTTHTLLNR